MADDGTPLGQARKCQVSMAKCQVASVGGVYEAIMPSKLTSFDQHTNRHLKQVFFPSIFHFTRFDYVLLRMFFTRELNSE